MTSLTRYSLFLLLMLTSCAGIDFSYFTLAREAFSSNKLKISEEEIQEIPYSYMKVSYRRSEAIYILASIENGEYTWVGADSSKIITINGQIIRTNGINPEITIQSDRNLNLPITTGNMELTITNPSLVRQPIYYDLIKSKFNKTEECYEYKYSKRGVNIKFKNEVYCFKGEMVVFTKQQLAPFTSYFMTEIVYKY